jgi:hypothetical protein
LGTTVSTARGLIVAGIRPARRSRLKELRALNVELHGD